MLRIYTILMDSKYLSFLNIACLLIFVNHLTKKLTKYFYKNCEKLHFPDQSINEHDNSQSDTVPAEDLEIVFFYKLHQETHCQK